MKIMRCIKLFAVVIIFINCSTISVTRQATNLSSITVNKTYQVRVRSGNLAMDKVIYEAASNELGKYLRITNKEPTDNFIDIVFTSELKKGLTESTAGYVNNVIYGNSWYTGGVPPGLNYSLASSATEIASAGAFAWQNSRMTVTIHDNENKILWKTDYNYKGGLEFGWAYVNTADEAARLSLDRIMEQFEKDFIIIPQAKNKTSDKMPAVLLVVEPEKSQRGPANLAP